MRCHKDQPVTTPNLENLLQNCVILLSYKPMSFVIMMVLFFKIFTKTECHQSKHAANMRPNVIQTRYYDSQLQRTLMR
jgi:hypothetical protein